MTGGGAGACAPTGNPCSAGTQCCTTVCSNLGTVPVCQPVSGCQVAGDYCTDNLQCCGGIPNGPVQCRQAHRERRRPRAPATAGAGSGCCPGTTCLPTSEISYACQVQQPTGDGGTTPDGGGGCKPNGTNCGSSTECCSQPQGPCSSRPRRCRLDCVAPDGGQKTCQPGATCPNAGQACTPRSLCCNEGTSLQCLDTAGQPCAGNSACTCNFIFAKGNYSSQP